MEEKSVSERMEEFVETLKLYLIQNVSEILDSALVQPLERIKSKMMTSIIAGFLFGVGAVFLAFALFFLFAAFFISAHISGQKEVSYGLSFLCVWVIFMILGYLFLRRSEDDRKGYE